MTFGYITSIPCLVFVVFGRGAFPGLFKLPVQVESCLKPSSDGRLADVVGKELRIQEYPKTFVIVREGDTADGSEIRLTS